MDGRLRLLRSRRGPFTESLALNVVILNPYLNFHRPCGFATVSLDERDKRRRQYKTEDYRTPFEKLKSLERAEQCLKPGLRLAELEREALALSDTEFARRMNAAKSRLLRQCKVQSPVPPLFR